MTTIRRQEATLQGNLTGSNSRQASSKKELRRRGRERGGGRKRSLTATGYCERARKKMMRRGREGEREREREIEGESDITARWGDTT